MATITTNDLVTVLVILGIICAVLFIVRRF